MKAHAKPLKSIFARDVRYVVPVYQRPYVWRKDSHWQPLWEDVQGVLSQWLPKPESERPKIGPHFLGAVVLDQRFTPAGTMDERHIIDGQQRLTTLQLLLAAAADAAEETGHTDSAIELRSLVFNDPGTVEASDDLFKVRPTNVDRAAYDAVLGGQAGRTTDESDPEMGFSRVNEAFAFFKGAVKSWLADSTADEYSSDERIQALVETLKNFVFIVVIDLEPNDNAQIIFETLNARGTPLLAIDLVKNLLLRRAQEADEDVGYLYRTFWSEFENWYWREEVVQGRLKRARAELFLMHWLAMQTMDLVGFHNLYTRFREMTAPIEGSQIPDLLKEFNRDAKFFRSFDDRVPGTPEYRFFDRLRAMDTSVLLPLVLFLFRQRGGTLNADNRNLALAALESWLVRRSITGGTSKAYNRIVLELLKAVSQQPEKAHETIIRYLQESTAETNVWPDDTAIDAALLDSPLYKRLPRGRTRMLLVAIENELRSEKSEEILLDSNKLTVEHVMPQSWQANWFLENDDLEAKLERDRIVHTLGNLTLVNGKLNSAASNSGWGDKRAELNEHSVLLLNRLLVQEHPHEWDEEAINRRTRFLGEYIKKIWPGPEADWTLTARGAQLRLQEPPEDTDANEPGPEDLIKTFALFETQDVMLKLLDVMKQYEERDVRVTVGKRPKDVDRRIFVKRRGYGAGGTFCQMHPKSGEVRVKIDPDEIESPLRFARVLDVKDPFRVVIRLRNAREFSEAADLARWAYDSLTAEDEDY